MDDLERMKELKDQGFYCSQILMIMGMELQGKDDPDLVRAIQGLAGGLGFSGGLCGALSGGACMLGLYAGKGLPDEDENPRLNFMIEDLVAWFKQTYGQKYGDIRCETIMRREFNSRTPPCAPIVSATLQKVKDLLVENGFDLAGSDF